MSAPGDPGRRLVRDRVLSHDQRPPTLPREATNLEQATQRFLSRVEAGGDELNLRGLDPRPPCGQASDSPRLGMAGGAD